MVPRNNISIAIISIIKIIYLQISFLPLLNLVIFHFSCLLKFMLRIRKFVSILLATIVAPLSTFCSTISQDDLMLSITCSDLRDLSPRIQYACDSIIEGEEKDIIHQTLDFISHNQNGLSLIDPMGMYFLCSDDVDDMQQEIVLGIAKITKDTIIDALLSSHFFSKTINGWTLFSNDEQILSNNELTTYIINDITTQQTNDFVINVYKKYAKRLLSAIESEMSLSSELSDEQQAIINNTIQSVQTQLNDSEKIYITIDIKENELSTQLVTTAKPDTPLNDMFLDFSHKQLTLCFPPINETSAFVVQSCYNNDTSLWDMLSICNEMPLDNDTTNATNYDQPLLVILGNILDRPSLKEWGILATSSEEQYGYLLLDHDCSNILKSTLSDMAGFEIIDGISTQWTILHNQQMTTNNMSDWIAYHDNIILFLTGKNCENLLQQWICLCEKGCAPGERGTCTYLQINPSFSINNNLIQTSPLSATCNNHSTIDIVVQHTKDDISSMHVCTDVSFETLHKMYETISSMIEQSRANNNIH